MLCKAETVPCVAVKLEDGVGVIIPKLKPGLGNGRREVKKSKPKAQCPFNFHCPFNTPFYNSLTTALEELII